MPNHLSLKQSLFCELLRNKWVVILRSQVTSHEGNLEEGLQNWDP